MNTRDRNRLLVETPYDHPVGESDDLAGAKLGVYSLERFHGEGRAADPAHYEFVLRLNSEMPHGSVAIREVDGEACFVMVNSYPRATADVEEIRVSVFDVARDADSIEQRLTGEDRH